MFPNPTDNLVRFQYFMKSTDNLVVTIFDVTGKMIQTLDYGVRTKGLNEDVVYLTNLPAAQYIISFKTSEGVISRKVTKF